MITLILLLMCIKMIKYGMASLQLPVIYLQLTAYLMR